jgi:hypothetical protein
MKTATLQQRLVYRAPIFDRIHKLSRAFCRPRRWCHFEPLYVMIGLVLVQRLRIMLTGVYDYLTNCSVHLLEWYMVATVRPHRLAFQHNIIISPSTLACNLTRAGMTQKLLQRHFSHPQKSTY